MCPHPEAGFRQGEVPGIAKNHNRLVKAEWGVTVPDIKAYTRDTLCRAPRSWCSASIRQSTDQQRNCLHRHRASTGSGASGFREDSIQCGSSSEATECKSGELVHPKHLGRRNASPQHRTKKDFSYSGELTSKALLSAS
jgi:hypothetical protein